MRQGSNLQYYILNKALKLKFSRTFIFLIRWRSWGDRLRIGLAGLAGIKPWPGRLRLQNGPPRSHRVDQVGRSQRLHPGVRRQRQLQHGPVPQGQLLCWESDNGGGAEVACSLTDTAVPGFIPGRDWYFFSPPTDFPLRFPWTTNSDVWLFFSNCLYIFLNKLLLALLHSCAFWFLMLAALI